MRTVNRKLPGCRRQKKQVPPSASLAQKRVEALERLVSLLEGDNSPIRQRRIPVGDSETNQMQRLAHLRAAHASYALSSGLVPKAGQGAWLRSRKTPSSF